MLTRLFILLTATILLSSCANTIKVNDKETFKNGTGIIGAFRQPIGFCSGGYAQSIRINGTNVYVKPTWTSRQDNLFSKKLEPGKASIESYFYGCASTLTTIKFKTNYFPSMIIPEKGFCKVVVSIGSGGYYYSKNDELLNTLFEEEEIEVHPDDIPYCEVE